MAAMQKLSTKTSALVTRMKLMMGTVTSMAITYGVYKTIMGGQPSYMTQAKSEGPPYISPNIQNPPFEPEDPASSSKPIPEEVVHTKEHSPCRPQPSVTSHDKAHALFLWIRVKDDADVRQVASSVAKLQQIVDEVEAPTISCCGNYRILAGVGFGPEFYHQVKGGAPQSYSNAKHDLVSKESVGVGGDILIHAKSNKRWMLEQLSRAVLQNLPMDSILSHEETYGQHKNAEVVAKTQSGGEPLGVLNYQYSKGDLELLPPAAPFQPANPNLMFVQESGFEDTEPKRRDAAVDPETGGSYVLAQRWVHDVRLLDTDGRILMNEWVDRAWKECAGPPGERKFKPLTTLGAELANICAEQWMSQAYQDCLTIQKKHPQIQIICTPGNFMPQTPVRIVRQSVPYTSPGGEFGLFFISYSSTPKHNELLLDRLIASTCSEDKLNKACSEVFRMSRNVQSACWYFPGLEELRGLQ